MTKTKENYTLSEEELTQDINHLRDLVIKIRDAGALERFTRLFETDYRVLVYLSSHEKAHPSVIAEELRTTRPDVAANLRTLEKKGFITRELDNGNRRQVFVTITEKGGRYLEKIHEQLVNLFKGWFQILGPEETKHLFLILELSAQPKNFTDEILKRKIGD